MKSVDVLRDHRLQFSGPFQLGQLSVGRVRFHIENQHLILIKTVKFLRVLKEKAVADDGFRRIGVLLVIETVLTPEIRNPALRGDARPSEKHNALMRVDDLLQFPDLFLVCHDAPSLPKTAPPSPGRTGRKRRRRTHDSVLIAPPQPFLTGLPRRVIPFVDAVRGRGRRRRSRRRLLLRAHG